MMLISCDISREFCVDKPKDDLVSQFQSVCMYCRRESLNNQSKLIKKYKSEVINKNYKIRHLNHYSCMECSIIKTK